LILFGCPNLSNGTMPTKISKPSKAITTPKGAPKASKASKAVKPLRKSLDSDKTAARFWLTYPPQRIKAPVIWKLGHQFKLVTSIRQASVTDVVGIVCLEIEGAASEITAGVQWLKKQGVRVEPVELSAVES
jgi:ABC-type methionine transport system ATPase subunit